MKESLSIESIICVLLEAKTAALWWGFDEYAVFIERVFVIVEG